MAEQRANRRATGAPWTGRRVLLDEGRAGNVQVGPRPISRELLEEESGGDGATAARTDVVEGGDVALEALAGFIDQRQLPHPLAPGGRPFEQPLRHPL